MNEMYARIEELCKKRNINITKMCREADIPRGNLTDLKNGRTTALSTKSLTKISKYFDVPLDYLLGGDGAKSPLPPESEITFDSFTYALYNEGKELTDENKQKLLEMARFFRQQQDKEP